MTTQPHEQPARKQQTIVCPRGHEFPLQAGECPYCPPEVWPLKKSA